MATLVETMVTKIYRTRCPHCRPPTQTVQTREATVTIKLNGKGEIIDVSTDCDWAKQGQDRT